MKHIKKIIGEYMKSVTIKRMVATHSKKDKCVMCGVKTEYDRDTHIDNRKYYIEGAGQMCQGCHTRIY